MSENLVPASTVTVKSPTACSMTRFKCLVPIAISMSLTCCPQDILVPLPQGKRRHLLASIQAVIEASSSWVLGYTMHLGVVLDVTAWPMRVLCMTSILSQGTTPEFPKTLSSFDAIAFIPNPSKMRYNVDNY